MPYNVDHPVMSYMNCTCERFHGDKEGKVTVVNLGELSKKNLSFRHSVIRTVGVAERKVRVS